MKTITKPIYYCDFCKKKGLSKHAMGLHEERCYHNPENKRPCFGCKHLTKKSVKVHFDTYNGEGWRETSLLFCNKLNHFLISPQTAIKGNAVYSDDLDHEGGNEHMPTLCEQFSEVDNLPF